MPPAAEVMAALRREAEEFLALGSEEPEDAAEAPDRLEPEALGGEGAVDRLKGWLSGVARAIRRRRG